MGRVANNLAFVAVGVVTGQLLLSSRSFLLARLIEPGDYGIWTGVNMLISLAPIVCLGTVEALLKQVAFYRGKNDADGLKRIENSVLGTIVVAVVLLSGIFLVFPNVLPFSFIQENLALTQITAVSAAIGFFTAYYYYRCIAYENFKVVTLMDGLRGAVGTACILIFAWLWGLTGAVCGYLASEIITWLCFGYVCSSLHGQVKPSFDRKLMLQAVRIGFPITIIWWVYTLQATIGRMVSISYLGNEATGYFGAAGSLATLFALIPNMVSRVFYPKINAQIGANADLGSLRKSVVLPTSAMALLLPITQVVVYFSLPWLFLHFLPKYEKGLECAQILTVGAFFACLIRNGTNYLIAIHMEMRIMQYVCASLTASAVFSISFVKLGFGVNGIAVAVSLAGAVLAMLIWRRVFLELKYTYSERKEIYLNFYAPFIAVLCGIYGCRFFTTIVTNNPSTWLVFQAIFVLLACVITIASLSTAREQISKVYVPTLIEFLTGIRVLFSKLFTI